jgi:hypothetical protein
MRRPARLGRRRISQRVLRHFFRRVVCWRGHAPDSRSTSFVPRAKSPRGCRSIFRNVALSPQIRSLFDPNAANTLTRIPTRRRTP